MQSLKYISPWLELVSTLGIIPTLTDEDLI